jgi:cell wall-associated NlpC family hydrolase
LVAALSLLPTEPAAAERYADEPEDRPRVYQGRVADVPLQPFTLDPQIESRRAIRVAYFAPRPAQRAEPIDSEDNEDEGWRSNYSGSRPTVPGTRAILRGGVAYAPASAPERVKEAIWAVNSIRHKPYHWGGGHGSFYDSGYDCSGAVSFALHSAGVLGQPLPSSDLLRYGQYGRGRWITIYSRHGHTFAMIAGLRLDTTDLGHGGDVGPRWYTAGRSTWGFSARHPAGL